MNRPVSPLSDGRLDAVASLVLAWMPSHKVWCEPYFHDGEVFFRKPASSKEIINDVRTEVMAFYLTVRQRWEQLAFLMESTVPSDFWLKLADELVDDKGADLLYRSWAYWVKCSAAVISPARWCASDILDVPDANEDKARQQLLCMMSRRLKTAFVSNRDPLAVISESDGPSTVFYVCPPDRLELKRVVPVLEGLKGKVILRLPDVGCAACIKSLQYYTDESGAKAGIYTSFRRQSGLFD